MANANAVEKTRAKPDGGWGNLTPEQRAERSKRMVEARRRLRAEREARASVDPREAKRIRDRASKRRQRARKSGHYASQVERAALARAAKQQYAAQRMAAAASPSTELVPFHKPQHVPQTVRLSLDGVQLAGGAAGEEIDMDFLVDFALALARRRRAP